MKLQEKFEIPHEEDVRKAGGTEKKIMKEMRRIWRNNEIREKKSWTEKRKMEAEGDFWYETILILEVNGGKRYYEFIEPGTYPIQRESYRYTPRKQGDYWIHDKKGRTDDVDRLVLGDYTEKLRKIGKQKEKKKRKELNKKITKIESAFEDAEKPGPRIEAPEEAKKFGEGHEKMTVIGEKYDHPTRSPTIYGTGEQWILQKEKGKIWHILYHGADGDDWSYNNVRTGGAGAIGHRIDWDDKIAGLIQDVGEPKNNMTSNGE